jgi:exodeoxyribonuclease V alpha subunit
MHRGAAGCASINFCLQNLLNPKTEEQLAVANFGQEFRVADRVMQVKNNYDKNVFNGDIGLVAAIDAGNKALSVNFGQKEVLYKNFELDQLTLAYAVSIHKSQGSEFDAVSIPIFTQHFVMLSKKLIYTAITRAKKLCTLVGQSKALAIAIKNHKNFQRVTFLSDILSAKLIL